METKELIDKISNLTRNSNTQREKTLQRLKEEAKKQAKELQLLEKELIVRKDRLEKIVYNIENIDEFLDSKKENKKEKEVAQEQ